MRAVNLYLDLRKTSRVILFVFERHAVFHGEDANVREVEAEVVFSRYTEKEIWL